MAASHHALIMSSGRGGGLGLINVGAAQSGSNPTVPVPTGYSTGDLMVIVGASNGSYTLPTGWSNGVTNAGSMALSLFYKWAGATESSVSVSLTGASSLTVMSVFRGWNTLDVAGTSSTGTGTISTNSVTTTATGDLLLTLFGGASNASTWTALPGGNALVAYNSAGLSNVRPLLLCYESVPNTGATGARSATNSSGASATAGFPIAFKP